MARAAVKPVRASQVEMTELVLPNDTNRLGNLLGGRLMHWIDIAAAISAQRHARQLVVTASMDELHFHAPIKVGWLVILHARVIAAFTSSMEIGVTVHSENPLTGERALTSSALLTFVALDKEGKSRGYIVHPDPEDKVIQEAFKQGDFKEFERHSRLGMVDEEGFHKEVARLKKMGAKYVTLKTGAYRPADLARAVKYSSDAKIDLLTVDGAGGGTGMSPWRKMNEWGIPTVHLESLLYQFLKRLDQKGAFIPTCAMAGGLALEDHIFKGIALAAPYIKAICLGRASMTAAI